MTGNGHHPQVLRQQDFLPLSLRGWGDGYNAYVHAMTVFRGHLYCGVFRGNLCWKKKQAHAGLKWPVWPIPCPEPDKMYTDFDSRSQLWRYDLSSLQWELAFQSPFTKSKSGADLPREISIRGFGIFQGRSDAAPALYAATFCLTDSFGPVILRSEDGKEFVPVSKPGLGFDGVYSFRTLLPFKGKLYTSLVGSTKQVSNYSPYPIVFASDDPLSGDWFPVSEPGFGNPDNQVIFELAEFNDQLYAATFNHKTGFELWRTRAEGEPPFRWECVIRNGAGRGNLNEGITCMCVFRGALYLGTCIQDGGYDRVNQIGPAGSEIIRVHADDSWDLIMGRPRFSSEELKFSASGHLPGFDDIFNGYLWRMCVHDDVLYAGTTNIRAFLKYANRDSWSEHARYCVEAIGIDRMIEHGAGFDVWGSTDGETWLACTTDGFRNPYNVGVRGLASTPLGLAVGTVNVFGPAVAVPKGEKWVYEPNARGGAEVWLGETQFPQAVRESCPRGAADRTAAAETYRLAEAIGTPPASARSSNRLDAPRLVLSAEELREAARGIDLDAVLNDNLSRAREYFDLEVRGLHNVPAGCPLVFVGNNPAVPLLTPLEETESVVDLLALRAIPVHTLMTLRVLREHLGEAPCVLASRRFYENVEFRLMYAEVFRKLGFVPAAVENGIELAKMGCCTLIYPEDRPSTPPYLMKDFEDDFIRVGWASGAPIVPIVFLGPHESRMLVEHRGQQIAANLGDPLKAKYTITFLPRIQVRDRLATGDEAEARRELAALVREQLQATIKAECANRPLVPVARRFQKKFGLIGDEREYRSPAIEFEPPTKN